MKILLAVGVWIVAAIAFYLVGGLVATVDPVAELGAFVRENAGLLGFLCGIAYLIWGPRDLVRR